MTPNTFMRPAVLCAALAAATLLVACAPILVGGAIVGGSMVVDRRSSGTQVDDQGIELKSVTQIGEAIGDRGHINITSYNRQVLVTGEVPTEADKVKVEQAVARIPNVRSVVNELTVGPSSSFGTRSNDTLLTSKVKASIVDAKDLQTSAYKVVTENSVVYLMGRVTEREAKRASEVARGVSGVRKVVLIFEIVTEAELAELQPAPAPAAASAAKP
jgi:osmotically-inducible protein OsmY